MIGAIDVRRLARLSRFVLLLILLRANGALSPDLTPVNFDDLNVAVATVETSSSDVYNQIFWLATALLATVPVLSRPATLLAHMKPASLLFVFLGLCLLSALWATHPEISVRRSLLLVLGVYATLSAVAYCKSSNDVLKTIYLAFAMTLVANIASLPFGFAFDNRGAFRGITGEKNFIGLLAAVGLFISITWHGRLKAGVLRLANLAQIAAWGLVLALSDSKTAMALAAIVPMLAMLVSLSARLLRLTLPAVLVLAVLIAGSLVAILIAGLGMEPRDVVGLFVSDVTFTGRDIIWQFILEQWKRHLLFGFGYGSFWGVGFDSPSFRASDAFIRLLNQSHNGYLDVGLAVGAVGLALIVGFLGQTLNLLERARQREGPLYAFGIMALLFVLLHNLTESSLARGVATPWIILLAVSFALIKAVEAPASPQPLPRDLKVRAS
jgi:O-antigen ligase